MPVVVKNTVVVIIMMAIVGAIIGVFDYGITLLRGIIEVPFTGA